MDVSSLPSQNHYLSSEESIFLEPKRKKHENWISIETRGQKKLLLALKENAPIPLSTEHSLACVVDDSTSNVGTLFRAILTYEVSTALGIETKQAESLGCAVEYFHTASLILDDLPCMDNATERRGRACVHIDHGEGQAILGALALITRGYGLLGQVLCTMPNLLQVDAHAFVEKSLGIEGILNGQALDLSFHKQTKQVTSVRVALQKTVPLIKLGLCLPAILSGLEKAELLVLYRLGTYWGLLYQAIDDLKDIRGDAKTVGKTVNRDSVLGRPNIFNDLGHSRTRRSIFRLLGLSYGCVTTLSRHNPSLAFLNRFTMRLGSEWDKVQQAS